MPCGPYSTAGDDGSSIDLETARGNVTRWPVITSADNGIELGQAMTLAA